MRRRLRDSFKLLVAVAALTGSTAVAAPAQAQDNPYERGPDPTEASVTAERGPFVIEQVNVPAGTAPGFNTGTIYAPTDTGQGTFAAIAVMPGFVSPQATVSWYGPRLASQGFVVFTLDSNTFFDFPGQRGEQLLAALDYLTRKSPVRSRIDTGRQAVMGWSMGGGGSLEVAAQNRPEIKAAIPLAPWDIGNVTARVTNKIIIPTLIMGSDADFIAAAAAFARPFYDGLVNARERAYLELRNGGHFSFTVPNTTIARFSISWMKRFVDNDTRYDKFLCPPPSPNTAIRTYLDSCPHA